MTAVSVPLAIVIVSVQIDSPRPPERRQFLVRFRLKFFKQRISRFGTTDELTGAQAFGGGVFRMIPCVIIKSSAVCQEIITFPRHLPRGGFPQMRRNKSVIKPFRDFQHFKIARQLFDNHAVFGFLSKNPFFSHTVPESLFLSMNLRKEWHKKL